MSTLVTLDGEYTFPAVSIPAQRWNGFASPLFTREVAGQIADALNAAAETPQGLTEYRLYAWEGDALVESIRITDTPSRWESDPQPGDETDRWEPDAEGLYGIGAFSWVWSEVEDTTPAE